MNLFSKKKKYNSMDAENVINQFVNDNAKTFLLFHDMDAHSRENTLDYLADNCNKLINCMGFSTKFDVSFEKMKFPKCKKVVTIVNARVIDNKLDDGENKKSIRFNLTKD